MDKSIRRTVLTNYYNIGYIVITLANMGNIYLATGLKDRAKTEFETVLKIRPGYVAAQQAIELLKAK